MDDSTKQHLENWLDRFCPQDKDNTRTSILRFLDAGYDDLLESHSWPEILSLAERRESFRKGE